MIGLGAITSIMLFLLGYFVAFLSFVNLYDKRRLLASALIFYGLLLCVCGLLLMLDGLFWPAQVLPNWLWWLP